MTWDAAYATWTEDQFDTEATPAMYRDLDALIEHEEREREWAFADLAERNFDPDLY